MRSEHKGRDRSASLIGEVALSEKAVETDGSVEEAEKVGKRKWKGGGKRGRD